MHQQAKFRTLKFVSDAVVRFFAMVDGNARLNGAKRQGRSSNGDGLGVAAYLTRNGCGMHFGQSKAPPEDNKI